MAAYFIWEFYAHPSFRVVTVDLPTAVRGRVTEREVNRQHFYWYLGNESTCYNFWSFEPGDLATDQLVTTDSLEFMIDTLGGFQYYKTLGFYLKKGARLRKQANSPYVIVDQDHRITRWKYRP